MNIPPKCEDLQLKIAELERREAALREELGNKCEIIKEFHASESLIRESLGKARHRRNKVIDERDALQQRLTVAEQLLREIIYSGEWNSSALEFIDCCGFEVLGKIEAALKPAEAVEPLGTRLVGCCCPPKGHTGIWAAAMCPVHFGLKRPGVKPAEEGEGS